MKKAGFLLGAIGVTIGVVILSQNKKSHQQPDINIPEKRFDEQVDQVLELSKDALNEAKQTVYQATDTVFGAGTGDQLKGKAKKLKGQLTGDRKTQLEGTFYSGLGKTKSTLADVKTKLSSDFSEL